MTLARPGIKAAMRGVFSCVLGATLCAHAAPVSRCAFLYEQQAALVSTADYGSFDQTRGSGFRVLGHEKCFDDAARLIHMYLAGHEDLGKRPVQILHFHAGQMNAMAGNVDRALSDMMKAVDHDGIVRSGFLWNEYVLGSMAFLKKDMQGLGRAIAALRNASDQKANAVNLGVLVGLSRCFDGGYESAYSGQCGGK